MRLGPGIHETRLTSQRRSTHAPFPEISFQVLHATVRPRLCALGGAEAGRQEVLPEEAMPRLVLPALCLAAALAVLPACGDGGNEPAPPADYTGTWAGDYTVSLQPGVVYQGTLIVSQSGGNITGTLTTNAGRTANVTGTISGNRLTATFTYTDGCAGSASATAQLSADQQTVTGAYQSTDCLGSYTGTFVLQSQ